MKNLPIITEPIVIKDKEDLNVRLVVERTFITEEGYYGVCIFGSMSNRCGYVGVDKDHVLHGADLLSQYGSYIDLEVHGGVTFSEGLSFIEEAKHLWFIGFDCGHLNDAPDIEMAEKYNTYVRDAYSEGVVRDLKYVVIEVFNLSRQMTPQALMMAQMKS